MSDKFVTIACKLPHGLQIEVGTPFTENYRKFPLNGPYTTDRRTGKPASLIVEGYAFTQIPEDVWSEFVKSHLGAAYLKNRAVYMQESIESAQAAALGDRGSKTGFEGLNPDKPAPGIVPDQDHLDKLKREAERVLA